MQNFRVQNFEKRALTQKISFDLFFIFSSNILHPLSADTSFKFLAIILFEIRHLQNFIPLFVKGLYLTRGDNSGKTNK